MSEDEAGGGGAVRAAAAAVEEEGPGTRRAEDDAPGLADEEDGGGGRYLVGRPPADALDGGAGGTVRIFEAVAVEERAGPGWARWEGLRSEARAMLDEGAVEEDEGPPAEGLIGASCAVRVLRVRPSHEKHARRGEPLGWLTVWSGSTGEGEEGQRGQPVGVRRGGTGGRVCSRGSMPSTALWTSSSRSSAQRMREGTQPLGARRGAAARGRGSAKHLPGQFCLARVVSLAVTEAVCGLAIDQVQCERRGKCQICRGSSTARSFCSSRFADLNLAPACIRESPCGPSRVPLQLRTLLQHRHAPSTTNSARPGSNSTRATRQHHRLQHRPRRPPPSTRSRQPSRTTTRTPTS